ncbi:MAG: putative ABC transporter permease [Clostridia bacterium]|nr:putative ABC transporter permease [Clostridia bacterium]
MKEKNKNKITDFSMKNYSAYEKIQLLFLMFMIGAFVGFIYEEIYFLIDEGSLTYRGMLWGPYLPVYGFGAVFVYLLFSRLRKYPPLIFIGSVILTGIVELITGYTLLKLFNKRWWDYRGMFMNFDGNGFVCLQSVLLFGVLSLLFVYLVQPKIFRAYSKMNKKTRNIIFFILLAIIVTDLIASAIHPNTLGIV